MTVSAPHSAGCLHLQESSFQVPVTGLAELALCVVNVIQANLHHLGVWLQGLYNIVASSLF